MKFQLTLISLLITLFSSHAQTKEIEYKLGNRLKKINTFSGDIDQKSSIHCIVFKDRNSKKYGIKPFYITEQDSIITLNAISFLNEPSILSFHKNDDNLTIIVSQADSKTSPYTKKLSILDIDILSKASKLKEIMSLSESKTVITLPNKSILVYYSVEEKNMNSILIKNTTDITETTYTIPKEQLKHFKEVFYSTTDFINTNEYIKNGSTSDTKVYYDNEQLVFDHINLEKQHIISLILDPKKDTSTLFKKHEELDPEEIKNINSFYHQGNLFLVYKTKEKTKLSIIDINTGTVKYNASLQDDFLEYFNPEALKTIDKKIKRSAYKPTITINKSIDNNNVIRLSYVDIRTYNYNHHFFWMQQQMMQQQMMMNQNMPGFGPHMPIDYFNISKKPITTENKSIKLVFDDELHPIKNASIETIRKRIDKDKHLEPLGEQLGRKHLSSAFTEKTMRTIVYHTRAKKFVLKTVKL